MKFSDIILEDYGSYGGANKMGSPKKVASGSGFYQNWGQINPYSSTKWLDPVQKKYEIEFIQSAISSKEKGYKPEKLSYNNNIKIMNLVRSGFLTIKDGVFFATKDGEKWVDSFMRDHQQQGFVKSHIPAVSSVIGMGSLGT